MAVVWHLLVRALWKELTEGHAVAIPIGGTAPYITTRRDAYTMRRSNPEAWSELGHVGPGERGYRSQPDRSFSDDTWRHPEACTFGHLPRLAYSRPAHRDPKGEAVTEG